MIGSSKSQRIISSTLQSPRRFTTHAYQSRSQRLITYRASNLRPKLWSRNALCLENTTSNAQRSFTVSAAARAPSDTGDILPVVETCPCTIEQPEEFDLGDLTIDHESPLGNVITRHYRHILIHTGTIEWPSRIESEANSFASKLKPLVSRGSIFVDPFYPILVTNSSLPPSEEATKKGTTTLSIFPEAIRIPSVPNNTECLNDLIKSHFLHPSNPLSTAATNPTPFSLEKITEPLILTCSHGGRDRRCGVIGPAITREFNTLIHHQSPENRIDAIAGDISHIGGHKYAGNVIIHLPADYPLSKKINDAPAASMPVAGADSTVIPTTTSHSVAIWYGRVMPHHAESIFDLTIRQGKVIKDLLRGIVNSNGDLVNLRSTGLL
ncbi:hypothetical protein ABW19_dt0204326 [Dactylella cylindrospora]|nr:hypothetical protein ABW19_dt0204326 [Dactylella cylindrospora]